MQSKESYKFYGKEPKERYQPGPGVIGVIAPLAPGAVNPMWDTEQSVVDLMEGKYGATIIKLLERPPKRKKEESKHPFSYPINIKGKKTQEEPEEKDLQALEEDDE